MFTTSHMVGREDKRTNNRTMFPALKHNAATGYQGPVKRELLKGAGLLNQTLGNYHTEIEPAVRAAVKTDFHTLSMPLPKVTFHCRQNEDSNYRHTKTFPCIFNVDFR